MKECSHLSRALPASLVLVASVLAAGAAPCAAQGRFRIEREENFRLDPNSTGRLLARVNAGAEFAARSERANWVEIVLDGWIWATSVTPDTRSGFDLRVSAGNGENLRSAPNGSVVARLLTGFLMEELERQGDWIHVSRTGWMWRRSLQPAGSAAPAPPAPPATGPVAALDRGTVSGNVGLLQRANGDTAGALRTGAPVRIVTRTDGWVRVQVDGWIRETDLDQRRGGVLTGVTGTEVRSRPDDFEGELLEWRLQYIAVPAADELRREIPAGRRYMLARGPVPERGFVYVILPDERVPLIEALEPLAEITIVGRVRTGRSHYLGNPVLEMVDFVADQP